MENLSNESVDVNVQEQTGETNVQPQESNESNKPDLSLRDEIKLSVKKAKERDETGKFKSSEQQKEPQQNKEPQQTKEVTPKPKTEVKPPEGWTSAVKQKWSALDPEVQAEIAKREADVHKMMTSADGELQLGRKMKETITPYMAIIQAEGGEPVGAVRDLLNTAYMLRTAQPQQKAALVQQIIQQYGVDMSLVQRQQQPGDPMINQLMQELNQLKQTASPEAIEKRLREQMENDSIKNEVQAFASDPANVHYEKVKTVMAALLESGAAKDMKEAYEAACRANNEIFSTLESQKQANDQAKKMAELAAKKKAGSSLTGSPSVSVPNSGAPDRNLREELRANLRAHTS